MFWTKKLKSAFTNNTIEVFFQPLVNNQTLNVDKYECLVRLIDEDGKFKKIKSIYKTYKNCY